MTTHRIGTPDEWRAARVGLAAEKAHTRRRDELARRRREESPRVRIDDTYRFETGRNEDAPGIRWRRHDEYEG